MAIQKKLPTRFFKEQTYEVESQTPVLTDEMLEEARRVLGYDLRWQRGRVEVTRDEIARFARMIGSENPLYLDENYARRTRWGGLVAPPTLIHSAGDPQIGPGMRGLQWLYSGADWTWFEPARAGDVVTGRGRLVDIIEKHGSVANRFALEIGEITYQNQRDQIVAVCTTVMARTPRAGAQGGLRYEKRRPQYTVNQLADFEKSMLDHQPRGDGPLYFEDVNVGDEFGPLVYGPLRWVDIALGGSVIFDVSPGAHVYQLLRRRKHPADTYIDPESGIQDHPHRGHWEEFMAYEVGMPAPYDLGPDRIGWIVRALTDWMGDDGFLTRMSVRLRRPNVVGDVTTITGKVTKTYKSEGQNLVDLEVLGVNQVREKSMVGNATWSLTSRAAS
jgi:acyl dehydratase